MELPSVETVLKWFSGVTTALLVILAPKLMQLRRDNSRDAAARAADAALVSRSHAETGYFDKAIDDLTKERDKWIERYEALYLRHDRDIREANRTIEKLWRRSIRNATPADRERYEAEYLQTRPATLDDLPHPPKGR